MTDSTTVAEPTSDTETAQPTPPAGTCREVRWRHSKHFTSVLDQLRSSLQVSTYAAGKLAAVGVSQGKLGLSFHNFEQAMGVAVRPGCMAVGAKGQIWFLKDGAELAPRLEPAGKYDACYMARSSLMSGNIHVHEMAWGKGKNEGGRMKDESDHAASAVSLHPSKSCGW